MSIYYYPPPLLLYFGYGIYTLYCHLPLPLFLMLLYWTHPYWPDAASQPSLQRSSSFQPVPHGLRTYVDVTYMIPRFYVVFTGIQLHPHFHWLCTYLKYEKCLSLRVLQLRSYLGSYKPRAPCYVTDGIQVYELCKPPTFFSKLFAYLAQAWEGDHTPFSPCQGFASTPSSKLLSFTF